MVSCSITAVHPSPEYVTGEIPNLGRQQEGKCLRCDSVTFVQVLRYKGVLCSVLKGPCLILVLPRKIQMYPFLFPLGFFLCLKSYQVERSLK